MRTLFVLIAIILAVVIIKRLITTQSRSKTTKQPDSLEYKDTIRCAYCGTHMPPSSALKKGENYYCSEQHYLEDKNNS
ncbi:MAG: PP0621 family protein [Gammaproteobacteria bacterium]|jgi:uncharacterized protein